MIDSHTHILKSLADEGRRALLDALREKEQSVSELAPLLGISEDAVCMHVAVLRKVNLVIMRRIGTVPYYLVNNQELKSVADWLQGFQKCVVTLADPTIKKADPVSADPDEADTESVLELALACSADQFISLK